MNGAERALEAKLKNKETGYGHHRHHAGPEIAQAAMGGCALCRGQLDRPQTKRQKRRQQMKLNHNRRVQNGRDVHNLFPPDLTMGRAVQIHQNHTDNNQKQPQNNRPGQGLFENNHAGNGDGENAQA